ncbi:MAG: hypothetical protein JRI59_06220, partial [Deltaproteobacteria bacterium]|nr:hypothetical protein [Deltaproteobacteria bacterium]
AAVISFALCEAVAVFGLVLFLLTGNWQVFYIFFAFSLLLFYLHYPKYEAWEKIVAAAAGNPSEHQA